ncbi:MAG: bifunctional DNA-formamidopyrimidine glycosylase/DNA-(apurinic or apyrimidinic site) lyase [Chloroflexi bacterium]|nr:bifunctional DNA-formamidopyrimidine glycosylase/DNA-(apurinic or apyrimidinic site) lyase [Chloroflexota bacterium]
MPELPDVEAIRRYLLAQGLVGRRIVEAELMWAKALREPSPARFQQRVKGQAIQALERRAKYLLLRLSGYTLVLHLGMTGSLQVVPAGVPLHPHVRNLFHLDDGRALWFADPRKLGHLWLVKDARPLLDGLGPEPFSPEFTARFLADRFKGKKAPVKALLLEQDIAAGVGNIYADEILFTARLHPLTPAGSLTRAHVQRIHQATRTVLAAATEKLWSIFPVSGPPTESAEGLQLLTVLRHEGAPCGRCTTPIERLVIRGRSAYFCPRCQGRGKVEKPS